MSTIRANTITDTAGTGAPTFSNGIKTNAILDASGGNTATINGIVPIAGGPAAFAGLMGYTSTATSGGATTLTNTSTQYQLFTGTLGHTVRLPNTSTLTTGWTFHIVNNSTSAIDVNSQPPVSLISIPPQVTMMVTCISTSGTGWTDWEYGFTDFGSVAGAGGVVLASRGFASSTITNTSRASATVFQNTNAGHMLVTVVGQNNGAVMYAGATAGGIFQVSRQNATYTDVSCMVPPGWYYRVDYSVLNSWIEGQ